jgi:hypothetical protein
VSQLANTVKLRNRTTSKAVDIGEAQRGRTGKLILILKQTCHHLWIGGWQLANVVFANIGCSAAFHAMRSCYKRQPAGKLLLSGSAIGEK